MADFCKQCSIDHFGKDFGDLAGLYPEIEYETLTTICEGCGLTVVNKQGECIAACLLKHGTVPVNE
jgi:hypothetical protein